jgi:hypothetical protein
MAVPEADSHYRALIEALNQLDEAAEPGRGDEASRLRRIQSAAQTTQDVLAEHQLLAEDQGGFIEEATGQKPALIPESERLKRQHAEMLHRANELRREVDLQFAFDEFDVELLRLETVVLRDILRAHLRRADSLLYEAYFRVEGGEG